MRIHIKFRLSGKKQVMPLNNQYPISAWIYKVLDNADKEFALLLHEHGYKLINGKKFKLFTFSKLNFPQHTWKIIPGSDRMEVWARNAYIDISFQLPEQIQNFVAGLFKEQKAFIGDRISGLEMEIETIETLKTEIPDTKKVKLKTLTPIALGINIDGKINEQYEPPTHLEYKKIFLKNLYDKYRTTGKNDVSFEELDFELLKILNNKKGRPKTELQTIKAFTPAETQVQGHFYEFKLTAPKEVLEVGLNSGFGSMNAVGFGFCEVISEL